MACSSLKGLARRSGRRRLGRGQQAPQAVRLEGIGDHLEETQALEQLPGRGQQAHLGAGPGRGHHPPGQGHRDGVKPGQAGDLLDEVHLPLQVAPEGGHLQHQVFPIHGQGGQMETPQQVQHLLRAEVGAQHLVGPGNPEVQPGVLYGRRILIQALGRHPAAAHLAHELGGPLQGMDHPVGVHPPLEAVGGLGAEPQALGGPADGAGIEIGAFQQHLGGGPGDLGIEPPHDPGQGHGPLGIANQQGLGVKVPLDAVQGGETGARRSWAGAPRFRHPGGARSRRHAGAGRTPAARSW